MIDGGVLNYIVRTSLAEGYWVGRRGKKSNTSCVGRRSVLPHAATNSSQSLWWARGVIGTWRTLKNRLAVMLAWFFSPSFFLFWYFSLPLSPRACFVLHEQRQKRVPQGAALNTWQAVGAGFYVSVCMTLCLWVWGDIYAN